MSLHSQLGLGSSEFGSYLFLTAKKGRGRDLPAGSTRESLKGPQEPGMVARMTVIPALRRLR